MKCAIIPPTCTLGFGNLSPQSGSRGAPPSPNNLKARLISIVVMKLCNQKYYSLMFTIKLNR